MLSQAERRRIESILQFEKEHKQEMALNIKSARQRAGFTQEDIAECLGVDVRTISRMENDGNCSLERILFLAAIYQCTLDELLPKDFLPRLNGQNDFLSTMDMKQLQLLLLLSENELAGRMKTAV